MDFIQRLALLLLLSIGAFLPNTALADYVSTHYYRINFETSVYYTDTTSICDGLIAFYASNSSLAGQFVAGTPNRCRTYYRNNGSTATWYDYSEFKKCGTTYSNWYNSPVGMCTGTPPPPTCTPPLVLDTASNTCKDPCDPKKWKEVSYFTQGQSWPYTCYEGCQAEGTSGDCGFNAAGQEGCFYYGRYTGVSCSGSESGTGTAPPQVGDSPEYDCIKQGKSWGTVNGTTVCVAAGSSGSSPTTSTKPASSSSNTTSNTDSSGNTTTTSSTGNGSKVVTFNGNGTATTSESKSTTNSDGTSSTTQETKTMPVEDFCKDNPTFDQCKAADKGSYSGSCVDGVATVQCDGDAAQCAIAQASAELNCSLSKDDPELTNKFNEAKNDNGSSSPAATANIQTINLPTALDATSPYSGQCIQDVTINVANSSVTLPFSAWCPYLEAIGYLFLACAYISAAYILGSAI